MIYKQSGFTLIELMVVVSIIAILAAVALPNYQNFVVKTKVGLALAAVSPLKTAVVICIHETGDEAGCDTQTDIILTEIPVFTPTKEVAVAVVANGVITLTLAAGILSASVDGETVTMTPNVGVGQTAINWNNTTTVSHDASKVLILRHNIAPTETSSGTDAP